MKEKETNSEKNVSKKNLRQVAILTECIVDDQTGSKTFIVREPSGRCIQVCNDVIAYTNFCNQFFV